MKEMYSGEQAKAIDTHAIDTMGMPSLVLMEKAAMSVVSVLLEKAGPSDTFLCVCGIGNNGGDGVVWHVSYMKWDIRRQLQS